MAMAKKPKTLKMTFGQRFKDAKKSGVATFTWTKAQGGDGKRYTTKTKDEVSKKGTKASVSKLKKKKRADVKKAKGFKAKRKIRKAFRKAKRTVKKSNKKARSY